jgi:NADP-dependent 3-hydroxy acid dehydrogenase YdfG
MIVITGASDGLGEALARKLAKDHQVVMLARNELALQKIAEETGADYIVCDVRDPDSVEDAFKTISEKFGQIDALINNAGIIVNGDLTETDNATIKDVIETNATGAMYVAKQTLVAMKPAGKGQIINVISRSGISTHSGRSIYNASKWAMTGFTKAIQDEAAEYGVRVTGFYPGTIKTKLFEKAGIELTGKVMELDDVVKTVEYILGQPDGVLIPHLEMRPF